MALNDILGRIYFSFASDEDKAKIIAAITEAYNGSSTAEQLFERFLPEGTNLEFRSSINGTNSATDHTVHFDLKAIDTSVYITPAGEIITPSVLATIIHEVAHALNMENFRDPSVTDFLSSTYDYNGAAVLFEKQVLYELGVEYQDSRASYYSYMEESAFEELGAKVGDQLTQGKVVDLVLFDGQQTRDIDVSDGAKDTLLVGSMRDDKLNGGGGSDHLIGGGGDDELNGNAGDDYIFGGIGNDTITDGAGKDFIEADPVVFTHTVDGLPPGGNPLLSNGEDTVRLTNDGEQDIISIDRGGLTVENGGAEDRLVIRADMFRPITNATGFPLEQAANIGIPLLGGFWYGSNHTQAFYESTASYFDSTGAEQPVGAPWKQFSDGFNASFIITYDFQGTDLYIHVTSFVGIANGGGHYSTVGLVTIKDFEMGDFGIRFFDYTNGGPGNTYPGVEGVNYTSNNGDYFNLPTRAPVGILSDDATNPTQPVPQGHQDNYGVGKDTPVPLDVFSNDVEIPVDGAIDIRTYTQPSHGTLNWDGSKYIYTPDTGFEGVDFFYYGFDDPMPDTPVSGYGTAVVLRVGQVNNPNIGITQQVGIGFDNVFYGTNYDDRIIVSGGHGNQIYGSDGHDVVEFTRAISDYSLHRSGEVYTITNLSTDETVEVQQVETLQFLGSGPFYYQSSWPDLHTLTKYSGQFLNQLHNWRVTPMK